MAHRQLVKEKANKELLENVKKALYKYHQIIIQEQEKTFGDVLPSKEFKAICKELKENYAKTDSNMAILQELIKLRVVLLPNLGEWSVNRGKGPKEVRECFGGQRRVPNERDAEHCGFPGKLLKPANSDSLVVATVDGSLSRIRRGVPAASKRRHPLSVLNGDERGSQLSGS